MASTAPRKILLVQHMLSHGGIDRVAVHLANGFAARGYDVRQLLFCANGPAHAHFAAELSPAVKLHHLGQRGPLGRTADLLRLLPRFIAYLRDDPPDVLISTANNMHWISAFARGRAGCTQTRLALKITNPVVRAHDSRPLRWLRGIGYDVTFAAAHGIWTLSDAETAELATHFPAHAAKMQAVINPYVTEAMLAAGHVVPQLTTPPTLLAIGRLNAQKQFDLLLRAMALLPRGQAQLLILGEGEERSALTALVDQLGLGGDVLMPGFVADVAPWLPRASLFILPSRYEGLPAALLEAMAANCPVLSTDCFPAARALLADTPGAALITPPTPERLAELIRAALAAPRPQGLATIARRWSIASGIASHAEAFEAFF